MYLFPTIGCRIITFGFLLFITWNVILMLNAYNHFDYPLTQKYNYTLTCFKPQYVIEGYVSDMAIKVNRTNNQLIILLSLTWFCLFCKLINDKINYNIKKRTSRLINEMVTWRSDVDISNNLPYNKSCRVLTKILIMTILAMSICSYCLNMRITSSSDIWTLECPDGNQIPTIVNDTSHLLEQLF